MLKVLPDTETAILGDNRDFSSSVSVEFLSLRFDSAVAVLAPNAVRGSIPDQIVDPGKTYIAGRQFIGTRVGGRIFPYVPLVHGSGSYVQKRATNASRVGYIGPRAEASGAVADTVGVRISPRTVSTVRITTDPARILIDFTLTLYSVDRVAIATRVVTGNTEPGLVFDFDIASQVSYCELAIRKATPEKRIWILAFSPSLSRTYSPAEIVKWSLAVKKASSSDASIGRIYIRSLDVTLFNLDRAFDEYNAMSPLFGATRPGVELGVNLALKADIIPVGTFFASTWSAPEDKAEVVINATDYLGQIKDNTIDAEIVDSITAGAAFRLIGSKIGLPNCVVDSSLDEISFTHLGISGKVGTVLNSLCASTQAICMVATDNSGLIVKHMANLVDRARYPVRWLTTDEYSKVTPSASTPAPTILKATYALETYDQEEIILSTFVRRYNEIPLLVYPPKWIPYATYDRPIGAEMAPSWTFTILKPANFTRVDFSDSFVWESLEYEVQDLGDGTVRVSVWNFDTQSVDQQLTVAVMGKNPSQSILLSDETHTIPARPDDFVAQIESSDTKTRNSPNQTYEFTLELSGKIKIISLVAGNRQRQGQFEFIIEPGSYGYTAKVWNYLPIAQDFQVFIYGRRLVESETSKTLILRDEDGILKRGEIVAPVTLSGMTSDAMAKSIARNMLAYYSTFSGTQMVEPWADPRLLPGDNVAVESQRGYGNTYGLVDEYSLDYQGTLKQKLTLLRVAKANRDGRVIDGGAIGDRPLQDADTGGFV